MFVLNENTKWDRRGNLVEQRCTENTMSVSMGYYKGDTKEPHHKKWLNDQLNHSAKEMVYQMFCLLNTDEYQNLIIDKPIIRDREAPKDRPWDKSTIELTISYRLVGATEKQKEAIEQWQFQLKHFSGYEPYAYTKNTELFKPKDDPNKPI